MCNVLKWISVTVLATCTTTIWLVGCGEEDKEDYLSWSKEVAADNDGRAGDVDVCQARGWYSDDECDRFCPAPDSDCELAADLCLTSEECGEGRHCDTSDCLSCCPDAPEGTACISACCGVCRDDAAVYDPCTDDSQCDAAAHEVCDLTECLSCCPDASGDDPCIDACCGRCVPMVEPDECTGHDDCVEGEEWCVDGRCVPCDNSGEFCDRYCPNGFVPPINGCQPCECLPDYEPCMDDADCLTASTTDLWICDLTECLSCCPGAPPGDPCIAACCGQCVEVEEPDECTSHSQCAFGLEWCVDGQCVPCDNSGEFCDRYCPNGFVPPINGCQPCECLPDYVPCMSDAECLTTSDTEIWVCDLTECLSCCPDAAPGDPCIAACCGQCVEVEEPVVCTDHSQCTYGSEWCVDGRCVPCDNSGLICLIPCELVPPINGCQPCQCAAGYEPCTADAQCATAETAEGARVCDRSECLSCCPDSPPGWPCIDLCCGRCVDVVEPDVCTSHDECTEGEEWCVDGRCVPCDNSGTVCDLYCPHGFVPPINGCQPCQCAAGYEPCLTDDQCADESAETADTVEVCDLTECLSCCPDLPPGSPCIAACCGRCVEVIPGTCDDHGDCAEGEEWCVDGRCVPCDNSGVDCDLYCPNGLVDPINGCQPCQCKPDYIPCLQVGDCPPTAISCDTSECLSCCPNTPPSTSCIALCCGRCVMPSE